MLQTNVSIGASNRALDDLIARCIGLLRRRYTGRVCGADTGRCDHAGRRNGRRNRRRRRQLTLGAAIRANATGYTCESVR